MRNPLVIARIEDEVKQGMQRKGYTLTDPMSADLVVDFTIGARERIDVRSHPGGWGPGPVWPGAAWEATSTRACSIGEGTLAIDVFDVHTRRPVWHGWAQKELTRKDVEQSSAPIHDAVELCAGQVPAGLVSCRGNPPPALLR